MTRAIALGIVGLAVWALWHFVLRGAWAGWGWWR